MDTLVKEISENYSFLIIETIKKIYLIQICKKLLMNKHLKRFWHEK